MTKCQMVSIVPAMQIFSEDVEGVKPSVCGCDIYYGSATYPTLSVLHPGWLILYVDKSMAM